MDQFLERCFYHPGQYDSEENFLELDKKLKKHEVINNMQLNYFTVYSILVWQWLIMM